MAIAERRKRDFVAGANFGKIPTIDSRQEFFVHNYGALKRFYAALGNKEGQTNVAVLGDSFTVGGFASTRDRKWTYQVAAALKRRYGGSGLWLAAYAYLGEWTNTGGTFTEAYGPAAYSYINTGVAQYQELSKEMTRAHIYFVSGSGVGNAEVLIDGVVVATVNTTVAGATTGVIKYDTGTLPRGKHTIRVRSAAGATTIHSGAYVWNGDYKKGVHFWEMGHSGYAAASWDLFAADADVYEIFGPSYVSPDLVIIGLGPNDQSAGVTKASYKASLLSMINKIKTNTVPDPSFLLFSPWARTDGAHTDLAWQTYREGMRELAEEVDAAFVDMYDVTGWLGVTADVAIKDAVLTNASAIVTSPVEGFFRTPLDVGLVLVHPNIPGGTTIQSIQSATQFTMSANATASVNPATIQINARKDPHILTIEGLHPSDYGMSLMADVVSEALGGDRSQRPLESLMFAISDETTAITAGAGKLSIRMPYGFELKEIRGNLAVAGTTLSQFDVNEEGVSILSTKLTIDANEMSAATAATPLVMSDTILADNALVTFDIDTAGTGAKGAKITFLGYRVA